MSTFLSKQTTILLHTFMHLYSLDGSWHVYLPSSVLCLRFRPKFRLRSLIWILLRIIAVSLSETFKTDFFFNIYTRETIRRRASTKRTQTLTIISRSCHLFISFPSDRLIARWCSLHHIGFVSHTVFSFFWQYFSTFHHWYLLFEYANRLLHNSSRTRPSLSVRTTNRALTWGSTQFAHHLKTQVNH